MDFASAQPILPAAVSVIASEAKQSMLQQFGCREMDCFVATLLAMTLKQQTVPSSSRLVDLLHPRIGGFDRRDQLQNRFGEQVGGFLRVLALFGPKRVIFG
jgi:hypothetical protein